MVLILLNFIRPEHEARWEKHNKAKAEINPHVLYGYINYSHQLPVYIIDIGNPSVNRSPSLFCVLIGELTSIGNKSQLQEVCQLIRE